MVGGPVAGLPILLLTTVGAKSGRRRTAPLTYLPDDGRYVVVAAHAGSAKHPAWYHNLLAHPGEVSVEVGTSQSAVGVKVLTGEEREAAYQRFADMAPQVELYQARTTRCFPVIAMEPALVNPGC